jgi:hypothetical protein
VYLSDANVQGLMVGGYLCYLFSCGNSGGLSWPSVIEHRVFTPTMSSHPPFCSRSTATASASTAASTEFAAAGAALRMTAADLDLNDDEDEVDDVDDEGDDDGDDSVVLVGKKPAAHPPPGKKAPFKCVSGEVLRVMQDRLVSNASKNNVDSSSHGTLKAMYSDLVKCRGHLVKIAKEVDLRMEIVGDGKPVLIADLLRRALPFEVTKRATSKSGIAETFTKSWAILSGIVANSTLGRTLTHQLEAYLSLMGRLESTAEHAISEADEVGRNSKSVKLTGRELHRPMLGDTATKPIPAMSSCAKCGHCLVDEPFSNRVNARQNKTKQEEWAIDHAQHEEYVKTGRNPLLDKNGKAITKHKNPVLLPELLVCHCWHNTNEAFAGGKECFFGCYDVRTKTQYKPGKCPVCVCLCHFVCDKE